jgi:hypothetical protein
VYPHLFLIGHHNRTKKIIERGFYAGLADGKRINIPIPSARDGMDSKKDKWDNGLSIFL